MNLIHKAFPSVCIYIKKSLPLCSVPSSFRESVLVADLGSGASKECAVACEDYAIICAVEPLGKLGGTESRSRRVRPATEDGGGAIEKKGKKENIIF